MAVLVTGCAGFLGAHLSTALLRRGSDVVGLDDLNAEYDPALKRARLESVTGEPRFRFFQIDIADRQALATVLREHGQEVDAAVHLAGRTGRPRWPLAGALPQIACLAEFTNLLDVLGDRLPGDSQVVYASQPVWAPGQSAPSSEALPVLGVARPFDLVARAYARLSSLRLTGVDLPLCCGRWDRPDAPHYVLQDAVAAGRAHRPNGEDVVALAAVDDVVLTLLAMLDRPADPAAAQHHRSFRFVTPSPTRLADVRAQLERLHDPGTEPQGGAGKPGAPARPRIDLKRGLVSCQPSTPVAAALRDFALWHQAYYRRP